MSSSCRRRAREALASRIVQAARTADVERMVQEAARRLTADIVSRSLGVPRLALTGGQETREAFTPNGADGRPL